MDSTCIQIHTWVINGLRIDSHMDPQWVQNEFIHGFRMDSPHMDSEWNHTWMQYGFIKDSRMYSRVDSYGGSLDLQKKLLGLLAGII